jgi:hypothetical protein
MSLAGTAIYRDLQEVEKLYVLAYRRMSIAGTIIYNSTPIISKKCDFLIEKDQEDAPCNVGRGRSLASILTTREEWVDALHELNSRDVDDPRAFRGCCLYSLLRLNPSVVCIS